MRIWRDLTTLELGGTQYPSSYNNMIYKSSSKKRFDNQREMRLNKITRSILSKKRGLL